MSEIDQVDYSVSKKRILERRASNHLREDSVPGICYLCGSNTADQLHHTSYFPEETIPICSSCHSEIHNQSLDISDELTPELSYRPDDYEKMRRNGINRPPKDRR